MFLISFQEVSQRHVFPEESILILEKWFQTVYTKEQRLTKTFVNDLEDLASQSKLSVQQVYRWIKYKKKSSTPKRKKSQVSERKILRDFFKMNTYPNKDELESLSSKICMPTKKLSTWFANERYKLKKARP